MRVSPWPRIGWRNLGWTRTRTVLTALGLVVICYCEPLHAQSRWLTGYLQTVPVWTRLGLPASTNTNLSNFSRFRLTTEPVFGPFSLEAAYEHTVTFRRRRSLGGIGVGDVPSGGEWIDLQGTIESQEHVEWRHRFDRLRVAWSPRGVVEFSAGRQAVSWGTTLFLTPADPFLPFNPADPFREFRGGVDAARVRIYPSPLSEIDVVVRPTRTLLGEEVAALGRGLATWRNWELSAWGGSLYGDVAGAVGVSGAAGAWAVRGEAVAREIDEMVVFRGTVGLDRVLQVGGRDLFVVAEYQRDNLAGAGADEYPLVVRSAAFRRGEFQVLGRDETVVQAAYQISPLWSLAGLWLWNVNDRSALLAPSVGYSAGNEAAISGGVFFGFGDDEVSLSRPVPSEYGLAGTTAYLSLSWFF